MLMFREILYFVLTGHCTITGVGVVSWSPLACGIITGKYENGVPESSRASLKVTHDFIYQVKVIST